MVAQADHALTLVVLNLRNAKHNATALRCGLRHDLGRGVGVSSIGGHAVDTENCSAYQSKIVMGKPRNSCLSTNLIE